jgi:hypothetical protein
LTASKKSGAGLLLASLMPKSRKCANAPNTSSVSPEKNEKVQEEKNLCSFQKGTGHFCLTRIVFRIKARMIKIAEQVQKTCSAKAAKAVFLKKRT